MKDELKGSDDLPIQISRPLLFQSHRKGECAGVVDGAVHQRESLRGDGGGIAAFTGDIGAGFIEDLEHRIGQRADALGVQRAAIALGRLGIRLIRRAHRAHNVARLHGDFLVNLRMCRNTADGAVELARNRQHGVAKFFGGQAARIKDGIAGAVRIQLNQGLPIRMRRCPLVCRRGEDAPMQFLERPTVLNKRRRQPVEQFRVRRPLARAAKVIRVTGNRLAEVPLPYAIHHHARRQRVVPAGNPLRQLGATSALIRRHRGALFGAGEQAQHARAHRRLRRLDRAALQNMDAIIRAVGHRECQRVAALELIVELLPPLVIHLALPDALGVLIKFFHRPIGLGKCRDAADGLRFL